MKSRRTRKAQRGGVSEADAARLAESMRRTRNKEGQIIHCLTQLRRFALCMKDGDASRLAQFCYNLGRLQELCMETTHPEVWWKPVEPLLKSGSYDELLDYIEVLRKLIGVEYDEPTLAKGCA